MELIQKVVALKMADVNNCEKQIMLEAFREVLWIIVTYFSRSTPPHQIQRTESILEDISIYARHHGKLTDERKHNVLTFDWCPPDNMCSHGQEHTIAPFSLHG
ncbi:hypothetical protein DPMN_064423 [Dreissena polymorpha]|uniref:Uncharacterized protein n=1 Tax=Dreissena polymorpha TaxID=45954 RepID=A0A9D4CCQ1_DREPO|nr:hypothetical protein DPMN_064423 [Dreissena polymorpha]